MAEPFDVFVASIRQAIRNASVNGVTHDSMIVTLRVVSEELEAEVRPPAAEATDETAVAEPQPEAEAAVETPPTEPQPEVS